MLAKKLYGEKSLMHFKTMLKHATVLSKCPESREQGIKKFMDGLNLVKEFRILPDTDLSFNMLLLMMIESTELENEAKDVDFSKIQTMMGELTAPSKYSHNQLKKQSLVLVHKASVFDGNDIEPFIQ